MSAPFSACRQGDAPGMRGCVHPPTWRKVEVESNSFRTKGSWIIHRIETNLTHVDLNSNHVGLESRTDLFLYICAYIIFHNSTSRSQTSILIRAFIDITLLSLVINSFSFVKICIFYI